MPSGGSGEGGAARLAYASFLVLSRFDSSTEVLIFLPFHSQIFKHLPV
jgi:hypothetical protein